MNTLGRIKNLLFFVVLTTYSMLSCLEPGDLKGVYGYIKQEYWHLIPTGLIRENNFLESIYCAGPEKCGTANLVRVLYHRVPGNFKISDADWKQPAYYFDEKTIGSIVGYIEKMAENKEPVTKDAFANELKTIVTKNIDENKLNLSKSTYGNEAANKEAAENLKQNKQEYQNIIDFIELINASLKIEKITDNDIDTEEKVESLKKKIKESQTIARKEADEKILKRLEQLKKETNEIEKKFESMKNEQKVKEDKKLEKKLEKNKNSIISLQEGLKDSEQKLEKTQDKIDKAWEKVKEIAIKKHNIKQLLETEKKLSDKIKNYTASTQLDNQISAIAQTVADSLDECGYFKKENVIFPTDVTKKILQAFAFEKMEEKVQLVNYFESIQNSLFEKNEHPEKIIVENATFPVGCYTYEEFKKLSENVKTNSNNLSEEALLYVLTFEFFYNGPLPKIITFRSKVEYKELFFPDCMETSLRNLFNIPVLDKENPFNLKNCTKELQEFYGEKPSQSGLFAPEQHNGWIEVVSNIPYAEYHRVLDNNKKKESVGEKTVKDDTLCRFIYGFEYTAEMKATPITILGDTESFHEITINNKKFIHVNKSKIDDGTYKLFEVMPTLKNAIIILDHHLNLGLFKKEAGNHTLAIDFFEQEFCNKFLEPLCKKLGWTINKGKTGSDIDSYTVSVFIETKNNAMFSINTKPFHGWVKQESINKRDDFWNTIAEQMFKLGMNKKNSNLLSFVVVDKNKIFSSDYNIDKAFKYYQFFMQQIDDENDKNKALELVKWFLNSTYDNNRLTSEFYQFIEEGLYYLVEKFLVNVGIFYHKELVGFIDNKEPKSSLAIKICAAAANAAEKGIQDTEANERDSATCLYAKLVEKGYQQAYTAAAKAAEKGFQDTKANVRDSALYLYANLVEKEYQQAYVAAINAAGKGIQDTETNVKHTALHLYTKLVEKGYQQAYVVAINAAGKGIQDAETRVRDSALGLFKKLFKKQEAKENAIKVAIKAASEGVKNKEFSVREFALKLFKKLVKNEYQKAYAEAINAAKNGLQDTVEGVRDSALELFKKLFKKKEAKENALNVATKVVGENKDNNDIQKTLNDLQEAIEGAQKKK